MALKVEGQTFKNYPGTTFHLIGCTLLAATGEYVYQYDSDAPCGQSLPRWTVISDRTGKILCVTYKSLDESIKFLNKFLEGKGS